MVKYSTRLKLATRNGLKRYATEKGLKIEHVLNQAIEEFLARHGKRAA